MKKRPRRTPDLAAVPPPALAGRFQGNSRVNENVAMAELRKSLGQHHLVDGKLCRPLLAYLADRAAAGGLAAARVVEIGPGGGVLTRELLAAGARVLAVELDPAWGFELRRRLTPGAKVGLAVADALELAWEHLATDTLVAGNLPYNVATALIARLLRRATAVPAMAFLVQLEVAERLVARPGSPAYGALSVLVALEAQASLLGRVAPGSFRPPPKVDSAFVGLTRRPPPLPAVELPRLERLIRIAFAQRRKTLRNSLGAALAGGGAAGRELAAAAVEALAARRHLPPVVRAEALDVAAFVELHSIVCNLSPTALN